MSRDSNSPCACWSPWFCSSDPIPGVLGCAPDLGGDSVPPAIVVTNNPVLPNRITVQFLYLEIMHPSLVGAILNCLHLNNASIRQQQLIARLHISCINPAAWPGDIAQALLVRSPCLLTQGRREELADCNRQQRGGHQPLCTRGRGLVQRQKDSAPSHLRKHKAGHAKPPTHP